MSDNHNLPIFATKMSQRRNKDLQFWSEMALFFGQQMQGLETLNE